jgi:2-methylcitrate dehydratase PrpD
VTPAPTDWLIDRCRTVEVDEATTTVAKQCVLDWFGVAIAGRSEPLSQILGRTIGRGTPWDAALVDGATGHALDFDDTHTTMSGHPTVPVLPAVLALGAERGVSGADALRAFIAGVEAECAIGALIGPGHYEAGFHNTGTLGTFGAAAACADLLGLDDNGWRHALGLAAAHAAGLKAQFGTMAKPLHAGRAAAGGLMSAVLAAEGYTAATDVLEAHQGFAEVCHGRTPDVERAAVILGDRPAIDNTLFKYHAACYLTHATIENARQLRQALDLSAVETIAITVAPSVLDVCNQPSPTTGLGGKFSLRVTAALGLLGDDTAAPGTYSDERVTAADVIALRDRVTVRPEAGHPATWSSLRITGSGQEESVEYDTGIPERDLDRQGANLLRKFRALAGHAKPSGTAKPLVDLIDGITELADIGELVAAAR